MSPTFLIQVFSSFFMTGLIWLVQLVHYPSFRFVDRESFTAFHQLHSNRITWIVAPMMAAELGSALLLLSTGQEWTMVNVVSVGALWLITGLVSVPLHNRLAQGYDGTTAKRLTDTNWLRTILWSARSFGLLYYLFKST